MREMIMLMMLFLPCHRSALAELAVADMLTGMALSSVRMQRNSPVTHIRVTETPFRTHLWNVYFLSKDTR